MEGQHLYWAQRVHLAEDNLWSQVLRSPTQCPGPAFHSFGKAKVCDLNEEERERDKKRREGKVQVLTSNLA